MRLCYNKKIDYIKSNILNAYNLFFNLFSFLILVVVYKVYPIILKHY